jgi:ComF family protein
LALLVAPALRVGAAKVDALVAVPLHAARMRERGYNQAGEIARALARELALPLLQRGIRRCGTGVSQTSKNARQRRTNVATAFVVDRNVRGLRLAIVDDVVTTGATVNALATALCAAGAANCVAWAVARTAES